MKRMLFNAAQAEELRVAIVDGQKLIDLDIETAGKEQRKSNIYKGVITRIEPSLEAAFVDYGSERHGFLPFKEVARAYFKPGVDVGRARIQDALEEGQELIVQVDKDERGTKGAALTTFISLAGRYLVLMPNNPRGGGVSRRIEGEERNELRDLIGQLQVPAGMSVIARTAGIGRSLEELQWDLNYLLQLWHAIEDAAKQQKGAFLIYQESSLVIRAIRDYFHQDVGEILIDTESIYEQARQFMGHVMPPHVNRVKLYRDDVPLFSRFQIEHQIETAFSRDVALPSGGSVVIDHTEAMVAIDVNSARATHGADIEETAFRTNLEAADEIARQLRLRDLGGLIVIDFIDMESGRNQREVENRLRDALHYDRARVQTGKISRFGLLQLSRQRLRPSLGEMNYIPCPRCVGTGHIRSIESTALHIFRIIQEEAMKDNTAAVHAQVPVDVATFLLNEKRTDLQLIEARHKVSVLLMPNIHLETPNYSVTRLRHDDLNQAEPLPASYHLVEAPSEEQKLPESIAEPVAPRQQAAVKGITPQQPAPVVPAPETVEPEKEQAQPSIIGKIFGWFGRRPAAAAEEKAVLPPRPAHRGRRNGARGERYLEERAEARGVQRGRGEPERRQGPQREPGQQRSSQPERAEKRRPEFRRDERQQQQYRQRPPREEATARPGAKPSETGALNQPVLREQREHGEGRGRRRRGRRERYERREAATQERAQAGAGGSATAPGAPVAPAGIPVTAVAADAAAAAIPAAARQEVPAPAQFQPATPLPRPQAASAAAEPTTAVPAPGAVTSWQPSPAPHEGAPVVSDFATEKVTEVATPVSAAEVPALAVTPQAMALEPISLPSDLTQIETDPEKLNTALARVAEETSAPRLRRVIPPPSPVSDEPLIQVETHKPETPVSQP